MGDAVGDGPGLARAGAGEDADRAAHGLGGSALVGVERRTSTSGGRGVKAAARTCGPSLQATLPTVRPGAAAVDRPGLGESREEPERPRRWCPRRQTDGREERTPDDRRGDGRADDVQHLVVRLLPPAEEAARARGHPVRRSSTSRTTPRLRHFVENVNGGNQTVPTMRFADGSALTNPTFAQVTGKLQALAARRRPRLSGRWPHRTPFVALR